MGLLHKHGWLAVHDRVDAPLEKYKDPSAPICLQYGGYEPLEYWSADVSDIDNDRAAASHSCFVVIGDAQEPDCCTMKGTAVAWHSPCQDQQYGVLADSDAHWESAVQVEQVPLMQTGREDGQTLSTVSAVQAIAIRQVNELIACEELQL